MVNYEKGAARLATDNERKCAIIGCGYVGATAAFSLMKSGLFTEIVLIDKDEKKAYGEAMDLLHAVPFNAPTEIYSGSYEDISNADIIVIAAGANQRPGQTRLDLVRTNVRITESIMAVVARYNDHGIILMVSNPVDILTYVAIKSSGIDPSRVIGSGTVLDTARLKALLGKHLGVDARNVHSFILGEHGDSEIAVWSSANVSGIDLLEFCGANCNDCAIETLQGLHRQVTTSAYRIIEAKGVTNYAIAEAVCRICSAIIRDENAILPVSVLVDGHYGLNDVCLGLPCIVGGRGVSRILDVPLDAQESVMLRRSAEALSQILSEIGYGNLILKD